MNDSLPLVTICIPTFNAESTIQETLESILGQSYSNITIQIWDNASSDDTLSIVESFRDPRIIVHRHEVNIGAEENFNCCIRHAEGKYTAIFHADDIYEPEMVARQVAFLEAHPEAAAVFTEAITIDETGRKIGAIKLPAGIVDRNGLYDFPTMFRAVLRHYNFFVCPSAMVRTEVYQKDIKRWRGDEFKSSADLDVWFRILKRYPIGYLKLPLMRYRISGGQWSSHVRRSTERSDFFLVMDHYLGMESVKSFLSSEDSRYYRWLERRDQVMRAANFILTGHPRLAQQLLYGVFSLDALYSALCTSRGRKVMVLAIYIKLVLLLRLNRFGRMTLKYILEFAGK